MFSCWISDHGAEQRDLVSLSDTLPHVRLPSLCKLTIQKVVHTSGTEKFLHLFSDERKHLGFATFASSQKLAFNSQQNNIHHYSSPLVVLWHWGCPAAGWPVGAGSRSTLELCNGLLLCCLTFVYVLCEIKAYRNIATGRNSGLMQLWLF